jgi:hypothetical protein
MRRLQGCRGVVVSVFILRRCDGPGIVEEEVPDPGPHPEQLPLK